MNLNAENYYSQEANTTYVSVSQYKDFYGHNRNERGCELAAMAKIKGLYQEEMTTAMLIGSYIDSYFEGTLPTFAAQHPEIYSTRGKTAGELKTEYKQASVMIDRALKDDLFTKYMNGDKQVIMTGEIEGVPFKIKIDSTDGRRITDLKTVKNISETFYIKDSGERVSFIEHWGYDLQMAAYQEIYRQNTGDKLPCYIAAISKDKTNNIPHPRLAVIEVPEMVMAERLEEIKSNINHIQELKEGLYEPIPCGICDFCADTLPLERVVSADQLILG